MLFFYEGNSLKPGIYEIRNRYSGRSYIGQAKRFKERITWHISSLRNNKHGNKFLLNDFLKCKEILDHDNFLEFHIIDIMENSTKEERNIKEEYWIKEYKENRYELYNIEEKPNSPEHVWSKNPELTKEKMRKRMTGLNNPFFGKTHTKEVKQKLKEMHAGVSFITPEGIQKIKQAHIGKKHSEESKKKMSINASKFPVLQYSKEGILIEEFYNPYEASKKLNINVANIYSCCCGLRKTAGGYLWKWKS
jgi:group I intron endonuclease